MSLLPNQSAVNPIVNFWGAGGSGIPSNLPFIVPTNNETGTASFTTTVNSGATYKIFNPDIYLPELPYAVIYTVYATVCVNNPQGDTDEYQLGIFGSDSIIDAFTPFVYKGAMGYNSMNISATCEVPPYSDNATITVLIVNTSSADIFFEEGTAGITIVGYPVSNQP